MTTSSQVFINKDGKEIKRTRCMVYSRVMGFIRPVQYFNTGKKSEFYSRTYFKENLVIQNNDNCGCSCKTGLLKRAKTIKEII